MKVPDDDDEGGGQDEHNSSIERERRVQVAVQRARQRARHAAARAFEMKQRAPHAQDGKARKNLRRYRCERSEHRRRRGPSKEFKTTDHHGVLCVRSACLPSAMAVMWYCRYSSVKKNVMTPLSAMPKRASITLRIQK